MAINRPCFISHSSQNISEDVLRRATPGLDSSQHWTALGDFKHPVCLLQPGQRAKGSGSDSPAQVAAGTLAAQNKYCGEHLAP